MIINAKLQDALNKQINEEMFSSYLYLSMDAHFESINLRGFAHWMRAQANEETAHAMRIYDYLVERGGRVKLEAIAKPELKWESPLAAFEAAYKHEKYITDRIDKLVELAELEKDHATVTFLDWFTSEQAEEEAQASEIVEKLKLLKDSGAGLLMLDHQLAKRGKE